MIKLNSELEVIKRNLQKAIQEEDSHIYKNFMKKIICRIKNIEKSDATCKDNKLSTIAFILKGGVGDIINSSAFLTALYEKYRLPKADIYIENFQPGKILFQKAFFVKNLISFENETFCKKQYVIYFELNDWYALFINSKAQFKQLFYDLYKDYLKYKDRYDDWLVYRTHRYKMTHLIADYCLAKGLNRLMAPGYCLNLKIDIDRHLISYIADFKLDQSVDYLNNFDFVTIHNGFDNSNIWNSSTKQWPNENWIQLVEKIKAHFPDIKTVQLGGKKGHCIQNVDYCMVDKVNFQEAVKILNKALLHIDIESGLVRLRSSIGKKSIVLFGPSSENYYSITGNIGISASACGNCFWLTEDWAHQCPRGLKTPECMASIEVDRVFSTVSVEILKLQESSIVV